MAIFDIDEAIILEKKIFVVWYDVSIFYFNFLILYQFDCFIAAIIRVSTTI